MSGSHIRQHYAPGYYYNHAEPHRRRPAVVNFPCTVWHVGIYHVATDRLAYAERLKSAIFENLQGWGVVRSFSEDPREGCPERHTELDRPFLDRFFDQPFFVAEGSFAEESADAETVFCFECEPPGHNNWTIRFELHSEYLTFTIFTRFEIIPRSAGVTLRTFHWDPLAPFKVVETPFAELEPSQSWNDWMSSTAGAGNPVSLILQQGFVADPDQPANIPVGPICKAARQIIAAQTAAVFCDFRGVITDWRLFQPFLRKPSGLLAAAKSKGRRYFAPDFREPGLERFPADKSHEETQLFLNRVWPVLVRTIFTPASENLVGCYLQGGHALYLSALGAQGLPRMEAGQQLSPLQFMVIYDPQANADREGSPDRWRLSRLTNRLIEVGVRRSASLRYLKQLRNAADRMKRLETRAEEESARQPLSARRLKRLMSDVQSLKMLDGELLTYRVKRNSLHYYAMTNLVSDLDVVKIPGWHPYDHFVKRRLSTTHYSNLSLEERLLKLEARVRGLQHWDDTFPSAPQRLITLAGFAAALAAIGGQALEAADRWPTFGWSINAALSPYAQLIGMVAGGVLGLGLGHLINRRGGRRTGPPLG